MSDEGFHEIQLNGKQLIFLCMTAALVLVVAFLSGVLVGRGTRPQKDGLVAADVQTAGVPGSAEAAVPAPAPAPAAQTAAAPPITAIAPPTPADEDLSYNSRLEGKQPPQETIKSDTDPTAPPPAKAPQPKAAAAKDGKAAAKETAVPAARPESDAAKAKAEVSPSGEPAGPGYYLKVAAYRDRRQADALAKRLGGKGFNAYIVPLSGRGLFSVQVGKYKTRREADSIRHRLEKEEQLKPLILH